MNRRAISYEIAFYLFSFSVHFLGVIMEIAYLCTQILIVIVMEKIFNRTKEEWMESIKKSIAQKQKAIADAQAQLKAERLAIQA